MGRASLRRIFPAPSLNIVSKNPILTAVLELKRMDPGAGQIGIAANTALPAVTRNCLREE